MTTKTYFGRNSFPLETRAALHHLRNNVSAESPTGRVISGLLEQLENRPTYVRPDWAQDRRQTLDYQIEKSLARLAGGM
jgi:hypothetical protein